MEVTGGKSRGTPARTHRKRTESKRFQQLSRQSVWENMLRMSEYSQICT